MTDITAITGIKEQDEDVFNEVVVKYSKLLWPIVSAVLKNVGNEQDVEECVADVFIDLWENPDKYDAERGTLKTWLCMVARCKAIDRYRVLSKHSTIPLEGAMMAGRKGHRIKPCLLHGGIALLPVFAICSIFISYNVQELPYLFMQN